MALTPTEKDQRKEARRARDHAWRARKELLKAREKEILAGEPARLKVVMDDAGSKMAQALAERQEYETRCKAELQALLAKHAEGLLPFTAKIEETRKERDLAVSVWSLAEKAARAQVQAEFPDLNGPARWSSASWDRQSEKDPE